MMMEKESVMSRWNDYYVSEALDHVPLCIVYMVSLKAFFATAAEGCLLVLCLLKVNVGVNKAPDGILFKIAANFIGTFPFEKNHVFCVCH